MAFHRRIEFEEKSTHFTASEAFYLAASHREIKKMTCLRPLRFCGDKILKT